MSQYSTPNSTNTTDSWFGNVNGNSIHLDVDDGIDGGSITTDSYAALSSMDFGARKTCELGISSLTDPADHTSHIIKVHAKHDGFSASSVAVALYEGSSVIYSGNFTTTTTFTTYDFTLPEGSAANISDYTNLRIKIGTIWNGFSPQVAEIEFQVPDAGSDNITNPAAFMMFI